jgi:hypothetical protein
MFNKYKNLTASGQVKASGGTLVGVVINSHTSGTLKLWDSLTATGAVICNTITFGASERFIPLYNASGGIGLFATIGGTADITIIYE